MSDQIGHQAAGTPGTGTYQGYTWNGRKWVDDLGRSGRFDPWQRTGLGWRIFFIALAGGILVGLSGLVQGWW